MDRSQNDSITRRALLRRCGMGFGTLALAGLTAETTQAEAIMAPGPHFAPKAKHVIHLFMNGGPSQVDTFDPKPLLAKYAGKPLPVSLKTEARTGSALPSPFKFRRHGQSGLEISEIFPHVAESADDLCVIRSMYADVPNHEPSFLLMNCGDGRAARPSLGAWATYGLGTENANLPGFVALCPGGRPLMGVQNWRSAFLPGVHQGTYVDTKHADVDRLVEHITSPHASPEAQKLQLDLLREIDADHRRDRGDDPRLEARIKSFELAYRMQDEAADAFDIRREPQEVRDLYGDTEQGRQLLIARRLVERGVRFVQAWHGPGQPWDSHAGIAREHRRLAFECDQAIGALLKDLKRRGLLDETLVVWGGEFGRTPSIQVSDTGKTSDMGRDHNHHGFSMWLAGGGVKGGHVHGATDDFGFRATEGRMHVHDLHATILHLLGMDHERLTYRYAGRDFRLTDVHGKVAREILA